VRQLAPLSRRRGRYRNSHYASSVFFVGGRHAAT
jgi:hypothetical protein